MADSFYSGNMAPPLRLPDGTLVAAPAVQPRETVDQMYQGIYPQSDTIGRVETVNPNGSPAGVARVTPEGLDVRNVRTVSIDPVTGNPVSPQVQTVVDAMSGGGGSLYDAAYQPGVPTSSAYRGGWGSDAYPSIVADGIPHAGGTEIEGKDQARLAASDGQMFAYGDGIPNAGSPGVAAITRALTTGPAFNPGTWGSAGLGARDFLSGDPGQTDWSVANGGDNGLFGIPANNVPPQQPWQPPRAPVAAPPAAVAPAQVAAIHAALMAKQQLQSPGAQAALAKGQGGYVVQGNNNRNHGSALGENALMPTRAMDGSVRYSYGD